MVVGVMGFETAAGLAEILDLVLLQSAGRYALHDPAERQRSYRELRRLFVALQPAIRPDAALEIGAYGAELSMALAREGIAVHAFEANGARHARCVGAIAESGLPVRYHHAAICAVDGLVPFHAAPDPARAAPDRRAGANSLLPALRLGTAVETDEVRGVTLAGYLAAQELTGAPFSAVIDVEGALAELLAGAGRSFEQCRALLVEVEDRPTWQGQMLAHEATEAFRDQGLFPVARDFRRPYRHNLLMLQRSLMQDAEIRKILTAHFQLSG